MIKLIDLIETKVTPIRKIPAIYDTEYNLIYINNWEYNGIEYGGQAYEDVVYFHFYLDNEQDKYNHLINKLKERRIPYKIEEDPELFTSVVIDIKYFDIPNRIKETKVAPKKIPLKVYTPVGELPGQFPDEKRYAIPTSWQGKYSYETEDVNYYQFPFYFYTEDSDRGDAFKQKLSQWRIPYKEHADGEISIDKKHFEIYKQ